MLLLPCNIQSTKTAEAPDQFTQDVKQSTMTQVKAGSAPTYPSAEGNPAGNTPSSLPLCLCPQQRHTQSIYIEDVSA